MAPQADVPVVAARGGSFLVEERRPGEVFTPEDLSEERRLLQVAVGRAGPWA
jgi:hypothetical protein